MSEVHRVEMLSEFSDEQRSAYGENFVNELFTVMDNNIMSNGTPDINLVVQKIEDSLFLIKPKQCYLVGGGTGYVDWLAVSIY